MSLDILVHSDTTNGSTTFTEEQNGLTIVGNEGIAHSTSEAKWGASSIAIANANHSLDIRDFPYPSSHSGFTIDFWFNPGGGSDSIIMQFGTYLTLRISGGNLVLEDSLATTIVSASYATYLTTGSWSHIGISCTTNSAQLYIDGVSAGSGSASFTGLLSSDVHTKFGYTDGLGFSYVCYIDEIALHVNETINFASTGVPTGPYQGVALFDLVNEVGFDVEGSISADQDIYEMDLAGSFDIPINGGPVLYGIFTLGLSNNIDVSIGGSVVIGNNLISGLIDIPVNGGLSVEAIETLALSGRIDVSIGGGISVNKPSLVLLAKLVDVSIGGGVNLNTDDSIRFIGLIDVPVSGKINITNSSVIEISSTVDVPVSGWIGCSGQNSCALPSYNIANKL